MMAEGLMIIGYGNGQIVLWDTVGQKALNMTQLHVHRPHLYGGQQGVCGDRPRAVFCVGSERVQLRSIELMRVSVGQVNTWADDAAARTHPLYQ